MNKQEIDARVQAAIENLQAGRTVEDDAGIEFKAEWPEPSKAARQLAGAANALRGHPLIYVVGVDDKTGAITVPTKTEPQEWYAKIRKPFDQIAPELLWSQTVYVGDPPESVVAMVFDTSDFPYVINGDNRREVPIRVASGTESAHRNQLVRMFEPSIRVPPMAITRAVVESEWTDSPQQVEGSDPPEIARVIGLSLDLHASVLIEHTGAQPTTLPVKAMRARLTCPGFEARPEVKVRHLDDTFPIRIGRGIKAEKQPTPPQFGVYALNQQVIATAPGEFRIVATHKLPYTYAPDHEMSDYYDGLASIEEMRFDLALRVGGVSRAVKLSASLARTAPLENKEPISGQYGKVLRATLGVWKLVTPDEDPWG